MSVTCSPIAVSQQLPEWLGPAAEVPGQRTGRYQPEKANFVPTFCRTRSPSVFPNRSHPRMDGLCYVRSACGRRSGHDGAWPSGHRGTRSSHTLWRPRMDQERPGRNAAANGSSRSAHGEPQSFQGKEDAPHRQARVSGDRVAEPSARARTKGLRNDKAAGRHVGTHSARLVWPNGSLEDRI